MVIAPLILAAAVATIAPAPADLVLTGRIGGADHQSYREVPFDVPDGVSRISVTFDYDKANRTVIDLGLFDPVRFRGWSGGSKSQFTVSASDATPGYLPGYIVPGRWRLLLGVPNARREADAGYTARISFDRVGARNGSEAAAHAPVRAGPGWYRGDLHMHSGHSDGFCTSQTGKKIACPLFKTVEAAVAAKLDFVAVTDHNSVAHYNGLREVQPYFDRLLLIPGIEITTFHGHANIFGPAEFVDFRLGSVAVPGFSRLADAVARAGAVLSINHPALPSGEDCMGCGWTVRDTDYERIQTIEAVNGRTVEGPGSGLSFWYARLNEGHHLAGIGGSDNHDATAGKSPIGTPTTVVHARELSQAGILEGLREGRIFIDVEGSGERLLDLGARRGSASAAMGETLAGSGPLTLTIHTKALAGARIEFVVNGKAAPDLGRAIASNDARQDVVLSRPPRCGWVTANARGADGRLLVIGNPIYLGPAC
ncbi:phosphotransferase [Sphingomonas oleivorans]|uniref:Phosphotransferase n=1 Tax=Sphingomonas oleivorans TaxID=1735121 RepID=A0A2T5G138_9SPHN|nr:CehA/McbA family metallohydrolase [Sphingomonas oleivorans]PTQ12864.1 phosphotransferase [Sphingomonas oleivorans]